MKHKKGYFKGKYSSYLLAAYSSYQKSVEPKTNKELAKDLGISLNSFYKIKSGKQSKSSKLNKQIREEISKRVILNNRITDEGKIIFKAVEKIKRREGRKKPEDKRRRYKIEELNRKEMQKLKKERMKKLETEIEDIFETHYQGEN